MSGIDQALDAVYAEARADREAHQARIVRELDAIADELRETYPTADSGVRSWAVP